jgi:predicted membrane protein
MSGRIALGALLLGAGALWLLSATDVVDLAYTTWIGILLIAIGLAVALSPGRHGFLVFLGILVVLAGVPAVVFSDDLFEGGIGDRVETPSDEGDLEPFRVGIGKLTVDLTSSDLADARVEASVGIGELLVLVPPNAEVDVDAHVGIGNVEAFDETESGVDVDLDETFPGPVRGGRSLDLDLEAGIGNVRVERD